MYGLAGERDLLEREMKSLPGYEGSTPVRIGNGAAGQYQADVVGEVMVTLSAARDAGLLESEFSWALETELIQYVADQIDRPDQGIWEIRDVPRMFTQSRVMVWVTFDRAVRAVEVHGLPGPVDEWRELRDRVRAEIDHHGVTDGHFTQYYGTTEVDASLLVLPQVGFCSPDDPRMLATVVKIERDLMQNGMLMLRRYRTSTNVDGLPGSEYPFVVQAGNTPQAFSHLTLIRAADALARSGHKHR